MVVGIFYNQLERVINLSNFKIKKIQYKTIDKLGYSSKTGRFSKKIKILEFSPDDDLI